MPKLERTVKLFCFKDPLDASSSICANSVNQGMPVELIFRTNRHSSFYGRPGADCASGHPAGGPRTLEIVSPGHTIDVHYLPREVKPRDAATFHGSHVELGQRNASACDELLFERSFPDDLEQGVQRKVAIHYVQCLVRMTDIIGERSCVHKCRFVAGKRRATTLTYSDFTGTLLLVCFRHTSGQQTFGRFYKITE